MTYMVLKFYRQPCGSLDLSDGNFPATFDATSGLVQRLTRLWQTPSLGCFNDIYARTFRTLDVQIRKAENHVTIYVI
jgi:hypothetical protein